MKVLLLLLAAARLQGESGREAWLRYAPPDTRPALPAVVTTLEADPLLQSAQQELIRGIRSMTGRTLRLANGQPTEAAIALQIDGNAPADSYRLRSANLAGHRCLVISGPPRGVLYGAFVLLRKIALGQPLTDINEHDAPSVAVRWVNHWDNLDGSIERGYGGRSLFWDKGHVREDLTRVSEYGRLLASLGINACSIDNVNADKRILTAEYFPEIARVAAALRPWGVRAAISVDFGSPQSIGGLKTFDPLDPQVAAWWKSRMDELYRVVPDLAGVVMKADSEGRVGPSAYNRSHADAANVVARALAPHGGVIFYRGFVYDHHMDWNNPKLDRARAADDNFRALDGQFDSNVIIQVKHGPIDFQVREPVSPLFGTLEKTNMAIELQITQEYFGQARHTVFLVPYWKEPLDFNIRPDKPVKATVKGYAGVSNAGLDENWFGNHLSQANLYGFGRLAWNPNLTSRTIADEWTRLTFGSDPRVVQTVENIQLTSWRTYENYTGPLGLQTLTNIVGDHYGVAVEASERNGWGQWHRADEKGVGMDRTVATGTGYIGQYKAPVARQYETPAACPDDLLLFMHHVPYTHRLHNGKTVIQYLYDSHYEGAAAVQRYGEEWKSLKGRVDDQRYTEVLKQLDYQAGQAEVWRDAVVTWFWKTSGIEDDQHRAGKHPNRTEAEALSLAGYEPIEIKPWEAASGGKGVSCKAARCTATHKFEGGPGWYDLRIQYFDMPQGKASFKVSVNDQPLDEWEAVDRTPARRMDASASARRMIKGVALRKGDQIRIEGQPDANDPAALDYIEISSSPTRP
jgi:alpha-glucuronidase